MKKAIPWLLASIGAVLVGCGGGPPPNTATKEELKALKDEQDAKHQKSSETMDAKFREASLEVDKKLLELSKGLPEMLKTYQEMKNTLEDLKKLKEELQSSVAAIEKKVTTANDNLIKSLEMEQKLLTDRLAELKATIEELKTPK